MSDSAQLASQSAPVAGVQGQAGPAVALVPWAELNPQPVLVFNPQAQLVYFNRAARQLAGAVGLEHPAGLLPEPTALAVQTCLATGRAYPPFYTEARGRALCWAFFPVAGLGLVQCQVTDVTEQQWWEQQLRYAQKFECLGRLAAGVAHDFSNLLTVIQGHTGLLRAHPRLTPDMAASLRSIALATERASRLTQQLLSLSRKTVSTPQRLNFNDWLTALAPLLERTLGEAIQIQFQFDPSLPDAQADPSLMEQALLNLAVHARDTMPQGGTLLIRTAPVQLGPDEAAHHPQARPGWFVRLTLADTGTGLAPEALEHLFEPFWGTTESTSNTGLGLAMAYSIVRQHQGWIQVHSHPGQGTTFDLYLPAIGPAAQATGPAADAARAAPAARGTETILVVEDEPPVRWTVRTILQRHGYRVLEACSGVEALALWHQHHRQIALLLTDIVLPSGLSGPELAEKFRHQKPELKVIYTSGYSRETAAPELDLIEGLTFLRKPFESDKLVWAVRACLDGCVQAPHLPEAPRPVPANTA